MQPDDFLDDHNHSVIGCSLLKSDTDASTSKHSCRCRCTALPPACPESLRYSRVLIDYVKNIHFSTLPILVLTHASIHWEILVGYILLCFPITSVGRKEWKSLSLTNPCPPLANVLFSYLQRIFTHLNTSFTCSTSNSYYPSAYLSNGYSNPAVWLMFAIPVKILRLLTGKWLQRGLIFLFFICKLETNLIFR